MQFQSSTRSDLRQHPHGNHSIVPRPGTRIEKDEEMAALLPSSLWVRPLDFSLACVSSALLLLDEHVNSGLRGMHPSGLLVGSEQD